ncbi:glutathione synthase [Rhodospirillaceae bacterium KN72]|uniref:Glutathione synthetase n=1 Tax=Pacificispira spongiicola TaxID=2729598 RepID=A0A7Y0HER4_9PROT|nr:glutathione synthase [Pacificispira spongiicola]NMM44990.1 glutathione synthase [Pacificispira spongiicola]
MTLSVAIQMDPIAPIDINADSSFALGLEAQRRGHSLYHYLPNALTYDRGRISARGHAMALRREKGAHYEFAEPLTLDLKSDIDVILMRQDPPFDMAYITATHILEHVHPETLVVNDPFHVRNAPEKLLVTLFPELMPETMITHDLAEIKAFRKEMGDIIVKPLFGNGGAGVFHLRPDDSNLASLMEMFLASSREPVMVQRYMPEVRKGDKRIILVDGKAVGAINRVPAEGEARSNMHVGGRPDKTDITPAEHKICEAIGPLLKERGLIFVGIDVIGDKLTEINVTSPTGIQEIDRYNGSNLAGLIWDAIESRL